MPQVATGFSTTPPPTRSAAAAFLSGKNTNSLIVQGTKAQVDAVLASLNIAFSSADADASDYKIRVTADDRLYNAGGVLTSGANGGPGTKNADGTDIDATQQSRYQGHSVARVEFQ